MPTPNDLKQIKEEKEAYYKKVEGLLQAKADPYKGFPKMDRYENSVYEVPEGMDEKDAMALTLGAMFHPDILNSMRTKSNAAGVTKEVFFVNFIVDNVFGAHEAEERLVGVAGPMAIARENAANAFKLYEQGEVEPLREMGINFITKLYDEISDQLIEKKRVTYTHGYAAKLAWSLMQNPDLGLEDVLEDKCKQQFRAYLSAYEMMENAIDAEMELHENLPEKQSEAREELIKKVWLMNAIQNQYTNEILDRNNEVTSYGYNYLADEDKKYGLYNKMLKDPVISKIRGTYNKEVYKNTLLPMQVILGNEDIEATAIDAYWEKIKETELYEKLMQADNDELFTLLEETKKEKLPEINDFAEELDDINYDNDEIKETLKEQFEKNIQEVSAQVGERLQSDVKKEKLLEQLRKEQASDRLIGSMKSMHEYVEELRRMKVDAVNLEQYQQYLEAMEEVVEKTEALYKTNEDGTYVPLTKEGLKGLQESYSHAYGIAKQIGIDKVCKVLENDIVTLGTLDKKNLTNLPDAIETSKAIALDISENQMTTVVGETSPRILMNYTDSNGMKVQGLFTENVMKYDNNAKFIELLSTFNDKYPNLKEVSGLLQKEAKKNPQLNSAFTWDIMLSTDSEKLNSEQLRDTLLNNVTNTLSEQLQPVQEVLENHREEAISFFTELVSKMSTVLAQDRIYNGTLGLPKESKINVDGRNVAVSFVADMLGISDRVAKSHSMELRNGQKVIKGCFTENAKGVDVRNLPKDHPMRAYKDEVYNHASGIKSMADMQVLDYICMNVKRDSGNMRYQFEDTPDGPKFVGVQGINNDASFGVITKDEEIKSPYSTKLQDLGVISQSVYDSIRDIDLVVFKLALKKQSLLDTEIEAACTRLQNLKDKIAEDAVYFEGKEAGELEAGRIRVVKDEDFAKLTIDNVLKAAPEAKMFKSMKENIMGGVKYANSKTVENEKRQALKVEKVLNHGVEKTVELNISEINLGSKEYYAKLQRDLSKMLLETIRNHSIIRGSSKQYKAVQQSLRQSIEILGKMDNPSKEEIETLTSSFDNIVKAANEYDNYKKTHSTGSKYEQKHKSTISSIKMSILKKGTVFLFEKDKYLNKQQEKINREKAKETEKNVEKKVVKDAQEANKLQIKKFVANLKTWNEPMSKQKPIEQLASAILVNTMSEYAVQCFGTGKEDKIFNMTEKGFKENLDKFMKSHEFLHFCGKIDYKQFVEDLNINKTPIETYVEAFKKSQQEPEVTSQTPEVISQTPEVVEEKKQNEKIL